MDPTGLEILDVKDETHQQDSISTLGPEDTSEVTIAEAGCVLEGAVRIARAISGNDDITLEAANQAALDNELFSGENENELTTENAALLISELTGKEIGYGSINGSEQDIKDGISFLDESDNEFYVTARIESYSQTDTSDIYKHTVNINRGLKQTDYQMGIDQQPVVDTSIRNRTYIEHGVGNTGPKEILLRADYFFVK